MVSFHVSAKTIKNKVSPPFRSVNFEIHFGKGIYEHEQIFDVLRKHGKESFGDIDVEISGTGAWNNMFVSNTKTGEVLVDKKFYKADFNEIINDKEYGKYIDDLLERVYVKKMESDRRIDLDVESYEEVRSVALAMDEEMIDPNA